MSGFQPTPTRLGRFNNFVQQRLIRNGLSRALTHVYSRLGLAHRQVLVNQLRQLGTNLDNHALLLDRLVQQGILKDRFRSGLNQLADIQPFMIRGLTTTDRVDTLEQAGLDFQAMVAERNEILAKFAVGIPAGFYSLAQYAGSNEALAAVFSSGLKYAKYAAVGLGIAGGGAGALWFFGVPSLTTGTVLAGLTATCAIAAKYNTALPASDPVGKAARFLSRKVAPFIYAGTGFHLAELVFEANLRISSIFDSIGLEGTTAYALGLGAAGLTYLAKNVQGFKQAFGGMLDPGTKKVMRKLMSSAALSSMAEVHYIGTRLMLLGGATAYMVANVAGALGGWGVVPLALPVVGLLVHVGLRSKNYLSYDSAKQANTIDALKVWSPFAGLAAGGIAALTQGLVHGLSHMSLAAAALPPIIYTTLYGSLGTLLLTELHGSFHSLNTNLGWMQNLKTSARDLLGEMEKRKLLREHSRVLAINPHTGTHEHTLGLIFSVLLNRKPGLSFVCMYDLILAQNKGGKLPNLETHRVEKTIIAYAKKLQTKIYNTLKQDINGLPLAERYTQLATNLRALADYYDGQLQQELLVQSSSGKPRFLPIHEVAEVRRAIFQELAIRAEEFMTLAGRLEQQAERGQISDQNFYDQWNHVLECYDPDLVKMVPVARKSLAGDERKIRKVENVATGLILRGITVYKGWGKERASDKLPPEDWIGATWTQVPNPRFSYEAPAGTMQASKFLWVKVDTVLTELQKRNRAFLSSSRAISEVENRPDTVTEAFAQGTGSVAIPVNGQMVPVSEFFYVTGPDQNAVPLAKGLNFRDGKSRADLPQGYQIGTQQRAEDPDMRPYVFTPPAFDYTIMMDKNDVQVNTTSMPAFLKRAARDVFIHLVRRYPVRRLFRQISYEFDNPYPDKEIDQSQGLQIVDTTVELSRTDDNGRESVIPYKVDRFAAHIGIDDSVNGKSLKGAKITLDNGQVTAFALIYGERNKQAGTFVVEMPPRDWPAYAGSLGFASDAGGTFELRTNNFVTTPNREGDVSWLKATYTDGTVAFARIPDGKRPRLFNKDLPVSPTPTYYKVNISEDRSKIQVSDVRVQRGKSIFVPRGWDRGLSEGEKLVENSVDNSGNIYFVNSQFTPIAPEGGGRNYRGQMLGLVHTYDANGNLVEGQAPYAIPLGNYQRTDREDHLEAAIEIVPSAKPGKMTVIERRLDTKGLSEDKSKFVYNFREGAARELENTVLDLEWIEDVRLTESSVVVTYATPESVEPQTLVLDRSGFRDNDGKGLLGNKDARVTGLNDIYQSHAEVNGEHQPRYTRETERFQPVIDVYGGNLRLIVHKVDRREIKVDAEFAVPPGGSVKIFPAAADAAVKLENGHWIPLASGEPIGHLDEIDYHFSQVNEGQIKQVIGPQTRFGEPGNVSSEYVRDPYFYGLVIEAMFGTLEKYGQNFAINRAKAVRANRGIQSGRTHVMPWQLLHNELADVMETNNPYLKKLSNFAEEIWGPGVSEDTQMEMAYWLKGIRMWVVKEMVALMAAEKDWGKYNTQNTERYNMSEVLFNLSFLLSRCDIIEGRFLGRSDVMMSWPEMSEISAGKTWYKMPFAKLVEQGAIPSYLLTFGHVLWYPVDLTYFIGSWLARTVASSVNYTKHLISLGYGFMTGFWKNPGFELTMIAGYLNGAMNQFLKRYQYATFALTGGGSVGEKIDRSRKVVRHTAALTGVSLATSAVFMGLGGLASWLVLPLGLAAIPLGLSTIAKGLNHNKGLKRFALAAGGVATALGGVTAAVLGAPALANFLSIALIANLGFGLYQFGLTMRALGDIRRTKREEAILGSGNKNQVPLPPELNTTFGQAQTTLRRRKGELNYSELFGLRDQLRHVLRQIDIMDDKGRVVMGVEHPHRFNAFAILETYADIEMTLAVKAVRDLNEDPTSIEAKNTILNLLRESKEHLVVDYCAKAYRRYNFKIPVSFGDFFRNIISAFTR